MLSEKIIISILGTVLCGSIFLYILRYFIMRYFQRIEENIDVIFKKIEKIDAITTDIEWIKKALDK